MAIKKSDLYSSLWATCDELRGKADVGDKINTQVIAPLVQANARLARSDFPDFNDSNKLGEGQAKVDRLTNLINIFADPRLDFSQNHAEHDDILGDACFNGGCAPSAANDKPEQSKACAYQIMISLVGIEPPVWRQVLVPGDVNLADLHWVIQHVMGWTNSHLHMFHVGKQRFGPKTPDWDDVQDERKVILQEIAPKAGAKFFYEYDMGDSWMHEVRVEKITQLESRFQKPECLAGARSCPPEDCGGIGGYEDMLAAVKDPKHEQHDEMLEWLGEDFDPEAFNLAAANKALGRRDQ